ncbi:bile acid:sodium symporter family protein [Thalassobacillus pellis]|uniref:bile acid:sodium symporter family protein n=1 Tax=Thalassobacillus pellis TaxID=748008 RepID=UPI00196105DB|nr:bile acid:sodium symporter family protein [Thalassobacillus pellis]MBM7553507.1 putative Na+-dependent transporter [Thalassobacillus pellis]
MLPTMNRLLQKLMPYITPTAVVIGVIFSDMLEFFVFLVPWIFAFMTFSGSLGSNFHNLKNVLRNPLSIVLCLVILHIIMPLIAYGTGLIIFPDDMNTVIGLILSFLIPTGITSLIWAAIYKGNVVLTLSIILLDTLLSPLVVPFVLKFLVGNSIEMNVLDIMNGLIWMIVIPSLLGMLVNQFAKKEVTRTLEANLAPFTKIGIGTVVAINSSAVAPYFKNFDLKMTAIAVTVFSLAIVAYFIGFFFGKFMKMDQGTVVSLTFNSGMRNISGGAVIAITYFPAAVAVPVIVCMLFQQVLASFTGSILTKYYLEPTPEMT